MDNARTVRATRLTWVLCCAMLSLAGTTQAATFPEFIDPHPAPGNQFGAFVVPLSTGNVVITSPFDDAGGTNAGAVYLFNGSTGALISTLLGSTASDRVGINGVAALSNGNFVVVSTNWDNGAIVNAGAVTWGSGTTGVSGVVSAANSLVGSTAGDLVGGGGVTVLSNGNYVVRSPAWDNGAMIDAGAATWGSGTTGVTGVVSAANSLVGSSAGDVNGGVTALSNGNYVVSSFGWDNGATVNAGAATWGSGTTGVSGAVSASNSLVGSTAYDNLGNGGVTALSNGNYVVQSRDWDNGATVDVGAVTWGSGTSGATGAVSAANSLVGSTAGDQVGSVTALSNGNYVVKSPVWDNGAMIDAGAVTWGSGTTGVTGVVSAANSLAGSRHLDKVGWGGVTALLNGNYVVQSPVWDNGAMYDAGAVTWGSGTTGVTGVVSAANSLVGSSADDQVGSKGVTALLNGNYLVLSPTWDNGAVLNAGAATWGSGTTGVTGVVSASNSLVGSTAYDNLGNSGATALSNGNYVVLSPGWDNAAVMDAGAATWGSGTSGATGAVSAANSLVGTTANDNFGSGVTPLSNGNYVVQSPNWDLSGILNAGAVTWGSGTSGVTGAVSAANSLVGSTAGDLVGSGVTALSNGNYVVSSPGWNNGAIAYAGAATWGSGTTGVTGVVSSANSLVGSFTSDMVGNGGVIALSNGSYVVLSPVWDNGGVADAGAATWGNGTTAVSGVVYPANSLVGTTANANLGSIVVDNVNGTFFGRFLAEGGGRVRVGPRSDTPPVIVSAVDIPNDQGGWLRLTFDRSALDVAYGSPPVTTYGVWRHVPGTIPAAAARANPGATRNSPADALSTERLPAALPPGLEVREVNGRVYVMGLGSRPAGIATAFPPGTWELVLSVPALQQAQYVVAVPTISNAAPNDFVVTAHTTTPSIWFISDPVSGQSVDNLAPAQPTQFTASYSDGQTNLQWAANTEHDLGDYRLYRGTSADFTPAIGNRIATQISTSYADVGPAGRYYKLSAVDVNGNQSGFALVTPEGTVGVGGEAPVAFALEGVRPNPASGNGLHVAFALPTGAAARLELLDVSGRRVLAHEVGSLGAGRHTVNLAQGHRVAPGLYWVRLAQGVNRRTARVAVIE